MDALPSPSIVERAPGPDFNLDPLDSMIVIGPNAKFELYVPGDEHNNEEVPSGVFDALVFMTSDDERAVRARKLIAELCDEVLAAASEPPL